MTSISAGKPKRCQRAARPIKQKASVKKGDAMTELRQLLIWSGMWGVVLPLFGGLVLHIPKLAIAGYIAGATATPLCILLVCAKTSVSQWRDAKNQPRHERDSPAAYVEQVKVVEELKQASRTN